MSIVRTDTCHEKKKFNAFVMYKYINKSGENAFDSEFDEARWFDAYGIAGVKKGKDTFYINAGGKKILEAEYGLTMFDEHGLGLVHIKNGQLLKYGMLTVRGNLLIPVKYESLDYQSCGLFCAKDRGEHLCLDAGGNPLFKLGKYKLFDSSYCDNRLIVEYRGKFYFMDTAGNIVLGPYWSAQAHCDGLAYVKRTEKTPPVFIDINGNEIVTALKYDSVSQYWAHGLLRVQYGKKYGMINKKEEFIIEPTYESIDSLWNGYYLTSGKDIRKVVDRLGRVVMQVSPEITSLSYADSDMVTYEKKRKWGYIDLKNAKMLTEAIYLEAGPMRYGCAPVGLENK